MGKASESFSRKKKGKLPFPWNEGRKGGGEVAARTLEGEGALI